MIKATAFKRPAALSAAVLLAAAIAAFAIGEARAQPVNPPIVMPPPTFNPSTPYTVPQPPPTPVSPTLPSGLGSGAAPVSPAVVLPRSETPETAKAHAAKAHAAKPARMHHHYRKVHARSARHHARFHAVRLRGPSYYPGLGLVPATVHPCHFRGVWSGYDAGEWDTYTCSW
jgi:hypothetical protein